MYGRMARLEPAIERSEPAVRAPSGDLCGDATRAYTHQETLQCQNVSVEVAGAVILRMQTHHHHPSDSARRVHKTYLMLTRKQQEMMQPTTHQKHGVNSPADKELSMSVLSSHKCRCLAAAALLTKTCMSMLSCLWTPCQSASKVRCNPRQRRRPHTRLPLQSECTGTQHPQEPAEWRHTKPCMSHKRGCHKPWDRCQQFRATPYIGAIRAGPLTLTFCFTCPSDRHSGQELTRACPKE
jgi:hypothetical protein